MRESLEKYLYSEKEHLIAQSKTVWQILQVSFWAWLSEVAIRALKRLAEKLGDAEV